MKKVGLQFLFAFLVACSPEPGDKKVPVKEEKFKDVAEKVTFQSESKIDVLFVIDDSGSMEDHQRKLIEGLNQFSDLFYQLKFIDFHIGVTTSTPNYMSGAPTYGGRLVKVLNYRYVDRNTPDGDTILKQMLNVGVEGDGYEEFFSMVIDGLTPPISMGENAGFLRGDALLLVIFLTDTDDQSDLSAEMFNQQLLDLKGRDDTKLMLSTAIIPSSGASCRRRGEERDPRKIEQALILAKGNGSQFSLCEVSFGPSLAKLADQVFSRVSRIQLEMVPEVETIRITYGSQIIPNDYKAGWTYDPETNSIFMGSEIELEPQPNVKLVITFKEKLVD